MGRREKRSSERIADQRHPVWIAAELETEAARESEKAPSFLGAANKTAVGLLAVSNGDGRILLVALHQSLHGATADAVLGSLCPV